MIRRAERSLSLGCGFGVFLVSYQALYLAWKVQSFEVGLMGLILFGCAWAIASHGAHA